MQTPPSFPQEAQEPPSPSSVNLQLTTMDTTPGVKAPVLSSWVANVRTKAHELHVVQPNDFRKEGLVTLMEIAEELGCEVAVMYVKKSTKDLQGLLRSLSFCGWQLVPPVPNVTSSDCVAMQYEL